MIAVVNDDQLNCVSAADIVVAHRWLLVVSVALCACLERMNGNKYLATPIRLKQTWQQQKIVTATAAIFYDDRRAIRKNGK